MSEQSENFCAARWSATARCVRLLNHEGAHRTALGLLWSDAPTPVPPVDATEAQP